MRGAPVDDHTRLDTSPRTAIACAASSPSQPPVIDSRAPGASRRTASDAMAAPAAVAAASGTGTGPVATAHVPAAGVPAAGVVHTASPRATTPAAPTAASQTSSCRHAAPSGPNTRPCGAVTAAHSGATQPSVYVTVRTSPLGGTATVPPSYQSVIVPSGSTPRSWRPYEPPRGSTASTSAPPPDCSPASRHAPSFNRYWYCVAASAFRGQNSSCLLMGSKWLGTGHSFLNLGGAGVATLRDG